MSRERPWLDEWRFEERRSDPGLRGPDEYLVLFGDGHDHTVLDLDDDLPRTRLIAAAPQLARALAAVEDVRLECVVCDQAISQGRPHKAGCIIDAALTAAGLDTADKREEARRWGT